MIIVKWNTHPAPNLSWMALQRFQLQRERKFNINVQDSALNLSLVITNKWQKYYKIKAYLFYFT